MQAEAVTDDELEIIEDEAEVDDDAPSVSYDITSYGADFDVEGLVRRLDKGGIVVPAWQRSYIWSPRVASSFVESLLLGLPVPGIFLGLDPTSKQNYVIDGQQRLRTLQYFRNGRFPDGGDGRVFKLQHVSARFDGATYKSLNDETKRGFDDALIHATIVRQDAPQIDDTSMCEVFRRLNTGGRVVNPQEIRCAVFRGPLIDRLKLLNREAAWREILGGLSPRLKDEEMVLRFFALWHTGDAYRKPMSEFLDAFTSRNRSPEEQWLTSTSQLFKRTVGAFAAAKGKGAFRLAGSRTANAAALDSMMIGLAKRLDVGPTPTHAAVEAAHDSLISDPQYLGLVTRRTSDETAVEGRLAAATERFRNAEQRA